METDQVKFDKIKPGMTLLDIHSHPMGNTTMRELGCWKVVIVSVDPEDRSAMARWNNNPERKWSERQLRSLVVKPGKRYIDQEARRLRR